MIDPDRPRFKAPALLQAAGITRATYANRKSNLGLYRGDGVRSAPRYSLTDISEAVAIEALVALGHKLESAAPIAQSWRGLLSKTLRARMNYGVWSRAGVVIEGGKGALSVHVQFDTIAEQVITALRLPLPVLPKPPAPKLAGMIVDMVASYVNSADFAARCDQFRQEVIARGKPTDWAEASAKLAVPLWIITEGARGIAEEADEAAEADTPPVSIARLLRERMGVDIIEAAP